MLIKTMKLRADELALYVAFDFGGFLIGSFILALVTYLEGSEPDFTVFRVGTAVACMIFFFVSVVMGMFCTGSYFNWHVGFGRTRKSFFLCDMVTEFCWNLISLILIWGFSFAEGGILKVFYSAYSEEGKILWGNRIGWVIPVFAFLLAVVREFAGSLMMRFGNKAFWVMWAVWMFICLVPGKIAGNKNSVFSEMIRGTMTLIGGISMKGWIVIGTGSAILFLLISWLVIRKQPVKA